LKNRGIALLAGIVLLAAISLLALTAASGAILQRNMAVNFQENSMALQNASIAVSYATAWLYSRQVNERERGCRVNCILPVGLRNQGELPARPEFETAAWWRSNAFAAGYNPETAETGTSPDAGAEPSRWIIEEIQYETTGDRRGENTAEGVAYYRIFGRGTGQNARSVAITEAIVARPWEGDFKAGAYPPDGPFGAFCRQFEGRYRCGSQSWRQRR
jgi:Tfp pilus assembly protein PilX